VCPYIGPCTSVPRCMHPYITTHTLPSYIAPALHQPAPPPLATAPTKCVAPRRDSSNGRRGNQHVTTAKWRDVARRGGARQHERRRYMTEVCMHVRMDTPLLHPSIPSSCTPHTYLPTSYLPAYLIPTCLPHTYLPTSYIPAYLIPTYTSSMHPHIYTNRIWCTCRYSSVLY
jgi:hypothetical protein